jgi:hypothetical protein
MEQDARANYLKLKEKEEAKKDEEEAVLLKATPWAQTLERDREVCVLFPGQGTQKKGMADKLMKVPEAKELFDKASEILGYDLAALISEGPQDKLDQTLYSQPAVFVTALGALATDVGFSTPQRRAAPRKASAPPPSSLSCSGGLIDAV